MESRYLWAVLLLLTFVLAGCETEPSSVQRYGEEKQLVKEISEEEKSRMFETVVKGLKQGLTNYTLQPGDVLEVMYHVKLVKEEKDYLIGVNDELNVEFHYNPELNRTVLVRPDGKITLPYKGDFDVSGKTPEQAAKDIARGYADTYVDPVVTVTTNKFSTKIFDLQKAITNAPRGQAKRVPVSPAGKVHLPFLRGVKVAGLSLDEAELLINQLYKKEFGSLDVSLLLDELKGNQIFVFGEVNRPGQIIQDKPITVLQAIAAAGGVTDSGHIGNVKVAMALGRDGEPLIRTVNLVEVMKKMKLEEDMILPPNSVVYVPKTGLAKLGRYVDQILGKVLMWTGSSFSLSYNRQIEPPF